MESSNAPRLYNGRHTDSKHLATRERKSGCTLANPRIRPRTKERRKNISHPAPRWGASEGAACADPPWRSQKATNIRMVSSSRGCVSAACFVLFSSSTTFTHALLLIFTSGARLFQFRPPSRRDGPPSRYSFAVQPLFVVSQLDVLRAARQAVLGATRQGVFGDSFAGRSQSQFVAGGSPARRRTGKIFSCFERSEDFLANGSGEQHYFSSGALLTHRHAASHTL